jgi:hypothetical protein
MAFRTVDGRLRYRQADAEATATHGRIAGWSIVPPTHRHGRDPAQDVFAGDAHATPACPFSTHWSASLPMRRLAELTKIIAVLRPDWRIGCA